MRSLSLENLPWQLRECAQCGADIIAPEWAGHLSDDCVRNVWSCEACEYQFEDKVYLSHAATDGD
jgi:ribosomal protein L37AE/L43A